MLSADTIDAVVNNAGITRRTLMRMTDDDWESVLNTNLTGVQCLPGGGPPNAQTAQW